MRSRSLERTSVSNFRLLHSEQVRLYSFNMNRTDWSVGSDYQEVVLLVERNRDHIPLTQYQCSIPFLYHISWQVHCLWERDPLPELAGFRLQT